MASMLDNIALVQVTQQCRQVQDGIAFEIAQRYFEVEINCYASSKPDRVEWNKDVQAFMAEYLPFRQFYLNHIDKIDQLLIRYHFIKADSQGSVILFRQTMGSLITVEKQTSHQVYPNNQAFKLFTTLLKISKTKWNQYEQNVLELVQLSPVFVSYLISKFETIFAKKIVHSNLKIITKLVEKITEASIKLSSQIRATIFYLKGHLQIIDGKFTSSSLSFQQALESDPQSMKLHQKLLKAYIHLGLFGQIWHHIQKYKTLFTNSRVFAAIEALAYFMFFGSKKGSKMIKQIKKQIDKYPSIESDYFYFNFCWGYYKFMEMDDRQAYKYLQQQHRTVDHDINSYQLMVIISFKRKKYAITTQKPFLDYFFVTKQLALRFAIWSASKLQLKDQEGWKKYSFILMEQLHNCKEMCKQWVLYFAVLYKMERWQQAINSCLYLKHKASTAVYEVDLNNVLMLCYQKMGNCRKAEECLGKNNELLLSRYERTPAKDLRQRFWQVLFLASYCFERRIHLGRQYCKKAKKLIEVAKQVYGAKAETRMNRLLEGCRNTDIYYMFH